MKMLIFTLRTIMNHLQGWYRVDTKKFKYYLATAWSIFAFIYVMCITFLPIPANNLRFADTIIGFMLSAVVATIMNFFFGSSSGSEKKTDLLHGAES